MKYTDDKIQQQIEAYLNQEMSDLDRSRFEKQIHDDPDLHEEVELQEAVLEAIRAERALALKAGLNQTHISLWSTGLIEAAKIAAITAGIGLASIGGYYYYQNSQTRPADGLVKTETVTSAPAETPAPEAREAEEVQSPSSGFESRPANAEAPEQTSLGETPAVSGGSHSTASGHRSVTAKKKSGPMAEIASAPAEGEAPEPGTRAISPSSARDIAMPTDGISNKSSLESVHPEVVIKRDNKDKFHYQFSDSKLILYADFSDKLYEVLELNQKNEKQLFFAYDGKFFVLDPNQTEISPLKEVTDKNLVQILSAYQKRKY